MSVEDDARDPGVQRPGESNDTRPKPLLSLPTYVILASAGGAAAVATDRPEYVAPGAVFIGVATFLAWVIRR